MKIHISIFTALSIMLLGCPIDEPENQIAKLTGDDSNLVVEGFDTSAAISRLSITEKFSRFDLSEESILNLSDDLDTLELTYYFGFCDCQRWIIDSIHSKAKSTDEKLDDLDPRGQVEFDLNKHGYYIEPASKDLEIDWRAEVNGTTIRFIGREYNDFRLPENGGLPCRILHRVKCSVITATKSSSHISFGDLVSLSKLIALVVTVSLSQQYLMLNRNETNSIFTIRNFS